MEENVEKDVKEIILELTESPNVLDVECISPDVFAGKTLEDIKNLPVYNGKKKKVLSDFFKISGEVGDTPENTKIIINGDLSRVKNIGKEMSSGEIVINGNVGMYVGALMKGGKIVVNGDADSFAGQQMKGGELIIKGNAGNYLGSSYRGDWRGMKGGTIIVEGNAGDEVGEYLSGGKIIIKGNVGLLCGIHINKGIIIVEGNADGRVGAEAEGKGIIVIKGKIKIGHVSFLYDGEVVNPSINDDTIEGRYYKFIGDTACRGNKKTVIYASAEHNEHLLPNNPLPVSNTDIYELMP
ncbi:MULTISPECIES: formylmethanofuran dehydrogenase subunit C [Methanococcaceae]